MPVDLDIPTGTNTLDDQPFDDGHPLSSWAGREVIHNDRAIHAFTCQSLLNKGWDITLPFVFKGFYWVRVAVYVGPISPGRRTLTVRFRGLITTGIPAHFAVNTLQGGPAHQGANHSGWADVTGTGAAANWEITGIPVRGGVDERIDVFMTGGIVDSAAADVPGTISDIQGMTLTTPGAGFAGLAEGWAIRLEDAASGNPLTQWRSVVNKISNSVIHIFPAWDQWNDLPAAQYESGVVAFRAREAAGIDLYNVAIDEDALSGSLGA